MIEPSLFVASACTGLIPGTSSSAGSWISPPPPTTASTNPAARPASASSSRVQTLTSRPAEAGSVRVCSASRAGSGTAKYYHPAPQCTESSRGAPRRSVGGVQRVELRLGGHLVVHVQPQVSDQPEQHPGGTRSEERRVGKERGSRRGAGPAQRHRHQGLG